MLIQVRSFGDLDFDALMDIYIEGNVENAEYFYPDETAEKGLALAIRDFRNFLCGKFFTRADAQYWISAEGEAYISALRFEKYQDGLLLEALETRPEYRGHGYAKRLILDVLKKLPTKTKIYSHVAKWNTASLATHRSCGFTQSLDYTLQSDGTICDDEVTFTINT